MPKKKRSGTQKKSKAVPDTVVLLPDALLKRYKKNVNRNKNVNVNIIKNVVNVPAPKKSRRRTSKATPKSGPLRAQGPGMLFSSPPVTIQSPYYGNPPYPVQPLMSRPVIPGIYADPDSHRVNIATDTRAIPIVSNENPNNLAPVNNQARLIPSGRNAVAEFYKMQQDDTLARIPLEDETPQDFIMGLDKVLGNINPFAGLNTGRADDLIPLRDPGVEADVDEKQEAVSSEPAVSTDSSEVIPGSKLKIPKPKPKPRVSAIQSEEAVPSEPSAPSAPLGWTEWVNANRIYDRGRKYENTAKYGKDANNLYKAHSRENYQRYLRGEPPIPFE